MRKDNRKVLSPSDLTFRPAPSPSGLTRGSRDKLANWFDLDSRVKPENDSVWVVVKPEGDVIKRVPENDSGGNENGCGWKRRGGVAVLAVMSVCLVVCMGAGEALAQCAVPPSCESLGYDKTVTDCGNRPIIKCPFDTAKVYCGVYVDPEGRVFGKVGDYYYSDGTMSESIISSKTIIGVVGTIVDNGKHGRIVSLSQSALPWSTPKGTGVPCLGNIDFNGAKLDMDGIQNTQCIISQTGTNTYPAAEYCHNYKAAEAGVGSSGWYLPAAGELQALSKNYEIMNESLSKLSKTQLSSNYWSSSEYSINSAWVVGPSDGSMGWDTKYTGPRRVRCVLAF